MTPRLRRSVRHPLVMLATLSCLAAPASAWAQVMGEPASPYPDPDKFARGLYVEADAGATLFLGEARQPLGPGMAVGMRLGMDLTRWLAFQARGRWSSHETDFATSPQSGQLLQILAATVEGKISVPLGQWIPFAFGGGGIGRLSTNLLGTTGLTAPDLRQVILLGGGTGLDYHPQSRHFTFGIEAGFTRLARVRSPGLLSATTHLRYTF